MPLQKKVYTKCAKLADKKSSVRDFEPKILIKGVHLTNWKKLMFDRTLMFFLWRKVYILWIPKRKTNICHRTTFYSIFNMSSYRNPKLLNGLPKITKIKWIYYNKLTNSGKNH